MLAKGSLYTAYVNNGKLIAASLGQLVAISDGITDGLSMGGS